MNADSIYADAEEYDRLGPAHESRAEVAFYERHARRAGGPLLELACGTGRLALPLAAAGFDVVGIDIEPGMLDRARAKARDDGSGARFERADVRGFSLGRAFGMVYFPNNAICHLHSLDDIAACLRCVRVHLVSDGLFIVETFNPSLRLLTRDADGRYPVANYVDGQGRTVVVTENNTYDAATQINHVRWYYARDGAPEGVRHLDLRMIFPQELIALLEANGFRVRSVFADYADGAFHSGSPRQIAVCTRRATA